MLPQSLALVNDWHMRMWVVLLDLLIFMQIFSDFQY